MTQRTALSPALLPWHKLALLAALALAWLWPGLVGHQPWKPDEAQTFGVVYALLQGGDWRVPMLAGQAALDQAPLYHWVAAAFARVFGGWLLPLHDAARLATGFFMGLALLFAGLTGRELLGEGNGRIAVLLFIGCLGLMLRAHEMIPDVALLAGFAAACYGLVLGLRSYWGGVALGCGLGVMFLARSSVIWALLPLTALCLPLLGREWRSLRWLRAGLLGLLVALPWVLSWPLALYLHQPALWREWLALLSPLPQLAQAAQLPWREHFDYLRMLPWFAWPAWPLALWALWQGRAHWRTPRLLLPLLLFGLGLLLLSAGPDTRDVRALPLLLPLALLATEAVKTLRRGAAAALDWFGLTTFGLLAAFFWFAWVALMTGVPQRYAAHLLRLQPGYQPEFAWGGFLLALAYSLAWVAIVSRLRRGNRRAVVNWAAGATLLWGVFMSLWLPWLDAGKSYRGVLGQLREVLPVQAGCVAGRGLGVPQRALLHYHAGLLVRQGDASERACRYLLLQGDSRRPAQTEPGWRLLWSGHRPGDKLERFWLYERG